MGSYAQKPWFLSKKEYKMSNNEHNDFMEVDSVSDKDKNPKENVEKIVAEAVDSDAEKNG